MPPAHTIEGNRGERPPKVVLSRSALANLELHSISVSAVKQALRKGAITHIDDKTGRFVYALDDHLGGIRIVAEKEGDSIVVLTAIRTEEILDHVG